MNSISVESVGLACPVGLSASASCAAMRAGIASFEELPFVSEYGEPVIGAFLSTIRAEGGKRERIKSLLDFALQDACSAFSDADRAAIPLLVVVGNRGGSEGIESMGHELLEDASKTSGVGLESPFCKLFHGGGPIAFRAIEHARSLVGRRQVEKVCVVAVDSLVSAKDVDELENRHRLKNDENSDGIIPGEAAACVVLGSSSAPLLTILGIGFAEESAVLESDEPLRGIGMSTAASAALEEAGLQMNDVSFRCADAAGESYAFKELTLVLANILRSPVEEMPLWLPAESIGDCGSASGLVQLVVATAAFRGGYALGPIVALHAAEEGPQRAVVVARGGLVNSGDLNNG